MASITSTASPGSVVLTTTPPHRKSKLAVKHQISPGISLISGGIAGAVEAATTGTTFKAGVRFLSFDSIRNPLMDNEGRLTPAKGILAGMIAGCVESVVAVTPTERVKTALIDDAKSGARKYAGGTNALVTMSATSAVRMGSYNVLREQSKQHGLPNNSLVTFGSGSVAGIVTVYATQPFDTIKTRAQSARGAGTLESLRMVLSERGIRGLWSGSTMRLGRLILSGGIVFTVYEKVSGLSSR
ncbi:hypothetical protein CSIM01_12998 [Colletotrichum simmondsii]|uniref:Tricarboxylate transport protein n=1 Tax=Colletotrichum simmondsii TaxID=703756 RepID=A0A135RMU5_9PEZI|nr:hypothetical protein CSIM01_12998 [Colletotrichum simmondsii]